MNINTIEKKIGCLNASLTIRIYIKTSDKNYFNGCSRPASLIIHFSLLQQGHFAAQYLYSYFYSSKILSLYLVHLEQKLEERYTVLTPPSARLG